MNEKTKKNLLQVGFGCLFLCLVGLFGYAYTTFQNAGTTVWILLFMALVFAFGFFYKIITKKADKQAKLYTITIYIGLGCAFLFGIARAFF